MTEVKNTRSGIFFHSKISAQKFTDMCKVEEFFFENLGIRKECSYILYYSRKTS